MAISPVWLSLPHHVRAGKRVLGRGPKEDSTDRDSAPNPPNDRVVE